MIPFTGFCGGPTNRQIGSRRLSDASTGTPGTNESGTDRAKGSTFLEPIPSNAPFGPLPVPAGLTGRCRGLLEWQGHGFGVNGPTIFSFTKNGAMMPLLQDIADDGNPVSMVANGNGQIAVVSAGKLYVITASTGAVAPVPIDPDTFLGASYCTFQDGYLIVITPGTNQFQISGSIAVPLGDFTQWDAANISIQAGQADLLEAIISSREYLRLVGQRRSQIYQNVGNQGPGGFPFVSYNETFIETGIGAPHSLVDMGESLIWLGADARGQRACWRDAAFQPQRISDYGVEWQWDQYAKVSDAVAFAYIWRGHLKYRITFPSANCIIAGQQVSSATWEYDQTESNLQRRPIWSQCQFLNENNMLVGRPELFHCFIDGVHVVGSSGGDLNPGALYQYSASGVGDCAASVSGAQIVQPAGSRPHLPGDLEKRQSAGD